MSLLTKGTIWKASHVRLPTIHNPTKLIFHIPQIKLISDSGVEVTTECQSTSPLLHHVPLITPANLPLNALIGPNDPHASRTEDQCPV